MIEETRVVYKAIDGEVFREDEKEDCLAYEKFLASCRVYVIRHGTDLTEGRYWLKNKSQLFIVGIPEQNMSSFVEWYCANKFGSKYQFVQSRFSKDGLLPCWEYELQSHFPILDFPVLGVITPNGIEELDNVSGSSMRALFYKLGGKNFG